MDQHRNRTLVMAGLFSLFSATVAFAAPPTAADMMAFRPKQPGIIISTPSDAELATCKVELVNGPGQASGWALKDAKGHLVRKFVASKGAKASIDLWCYYLEGNEVYREVDSNDNKKADQYRWFGVAGMRWGVDVNEDGRIDGWKMISAEEVSQEVLKAIITKDVGRMQALLINDAEIKALGLVTSDEQKIAQAVAQAPQKFQQTMQALSQLNEKTQWLKLEVQAPQCIPAEQTGGKNDLVRYSDASLLYQNGEKPDWVSLGEIIQIGRAWRLVTAPTPGLPNTPGPNPGGGGPIAGNIPEAIRLEMEKVDRLAPPPNAPALDVARFNLQKAGVLEKTVAAVPAKEKEAWIRQLADCLAAASQNGEKTGQIKLVALREQLDKRQPGNPLAGYVAYREISAEYSSKANKPKMTNDEVSKLQEWWRTTLMQFVKTYPTAEDVPDASINIGMVSEFMGKESDAKESYVKLFQGHPQHPYAKKAEGALRRIDSEGKPFALAGPTIESGQFNIAQTNGKTTIVYYWASWSGQHGADFTKLNALAKQFADKGIAVVTVNLDDNIPAAKAALQSAQFTGPTLHTPGGLEGPLATQYGVMVLPHMFLVGKDGKVISRTVQMSNLEDEIKKATDK